MPKTPSHDLSVSRKNAAGFLVKIFGECCVSTMLTAACYWPSCHSIAAHRFVSAPAEWNRNRSPWLLNSAIGVCCHNSSS